MAFGKTGGIRAGKAFVELFADDSKLLRGLRAAQAKVEKFGNAVRGIGTKMMVAAGLMSVPFIYSAKAAGDAIETLNKFEQVFGVQAAAAREFADELAKAVGRSRYEIYDTLASFHAFFLGFGFGADKAREMAQEIQKLALDFASLYNIQDKEAIEKIQSGLAGMPRTLREYGINILDSTVQQEAFNMGIAKGTGELTGQQKVLARYSLIAKTLTKQGVVGDAVRTAGEFVNMMKRLRAYVHDTAVAIGLAILPAVTDLVRRIVDVVASVRDWAEANPKLIQTLAKLTVAIGVGGALLVGVGTLITLLGGLLNPVGAVIAALLALGGVLGGVAITNRLFASSAATATQNISQSAAAADKLVARYEELVKKTHRTAAEALELHNITERLKKLFPEWASEIDGTAESLKRLELRMRQFGEGTKDLGPAGRALALQETEAEIAATTRRIKVLGGRLRGREPASRLEHEQAAEIEQLAAKLLKLRQHKKEVLAPGGALSTTPKGGRAGAVSEDAAITHEAEAERKLHDLRIAAIRDEEKRRLEEINVRYEREYKAAQDIKASEKELGLIQQQWEQARANAMVEFRLKKEEEFAREHERQAEEQMASRERMERHALSVQEALAVERIRAAKDGIAEEVTLLQLELEKALREAVQVGAPPEVIAQIEELFALREQAVRAAGETVSVAGTFSSEALWGMGGGSALDRTAKATEENVKVSKDIERNTERTLQVIEGGGWVFA